MACWPAGVTHVARWGNTAFNTFYWLVQMVLPKWDRWRPECLLSCVLFRLFRTLAILLSDLCFQRVLPDRSEEIQTSCVQTDSWLMMQSRLDGSPHSQSECDDNLSWRLKTGETDTPESLWFLIDRNSAVFGSFRLRNILSHFNLVKMLLSLLCCSLSLNHFNPDPFINCHFT